MKTPGEAETYPDRNWQACDDQTVPTYFHRNDGANDLSPQGSFVVNQMFGCLNAADHR